MGIYLVSVGAGQWLGDEEGDLGEVAAALDAELKRRGLPAYEPAPGESFEEKLVPPMAGFDTLCRTHLSLEEYQMLSGWSALVPILLDGPVRLPIENSYDDETVIASAPRVLALAEHLAQAIGLPPDVPRARHPLELTTWLLDGGAAKQATASPGPWGEDLDTAFYVVLYLRAAQHAIRHNCPLVFA
ncbi:hypothetical protein OOK31_36140 [Streptomyces sp. NBC_00249]|uniref:hypothetical protein n=1 Tax=Streptomyces sp. NBC_00249 TaxID=2975690 RepID=UPI0022583980|nr:hypothetical protein [Streptomyces sp. NBC_00249]MCX5199253.1 hypothetical protein [Streptomyces sp. NBC_00249]